MVQMVGNNYKFPDVYTPTLVEQMYVSYLDKSNTLEIYSAYEMTGKRKKQPLTEFILCEVIYLIVHRPSKKERIELKLSINKKGFGQELIQVLKEKLKDNISHFTLIYLNKNLNKFIPFIEIAVEHNQVNFYTKRQLKKDKVLCYTEENGIQEYGNFKKSIILGLFQTNSIDTVMSSLLDIQNHAHGNNRKYADTKEVQWAIENISYTHNSNVGKKELCNVLNCIKQSKENIEKIFNIESFGTFPKYIIMKKPSLLGRYEAIENQISINIADSHDLIRTHYHELGHFLHLYPLHYRDSPNYLSIRLFEQECKLLPKPKYIKLNHGYSPSYLNNSHEIIARYFETYMVYVSTDGEEQEELLAQNSATNTFDEIIIFEKLLVKYNFITTPHIENKFNKSNANNNQYYTDSFANLDTWLEHGRV